MHQSILADMLSSLHEYLLRPALLTSVVVSTLSLSLDFEHLQLVADATFTVSTVNGAGPRLVLGSLQGSTTVTMGPIRDLVFDFRRPSLQMVLDADLRRAAGAIAEQRLQSERDEGGGGGGEDGEDLGGGGDEGGEGGEGEPRKALGRRVFDSLSGMMRPAEPEPLRLYNATALVERERQREMHTNIPT